MPRLLPKTGSPCCQSLPPSHSGQWPLALLLAAPLQGMRLESWETGPGVGVPALQGSALASGCNESWSSRSSRTWGLGTTYQGAGRGSKGAWGRRFAARHAGPPSAWWVGGTKLASRPQLKLAVSLRGNEHACQPPRSPLPRQAICRHVLLSPPGSPSSSHPQGLEGL